MREQRRRRHDDAGPAGAFHSSDAHRPTATETIPARAASAAICSAFWENRRAAAGGMMSIEMMSRIPIASWRRR